MKETVNTVLQSKKYDLFKRIQGNRTLDAGHIKRLRASMAEQDLMIPIVVNERMEVIDGQHRLYVRQELQLPVYYIVVKGLGVAETQRVNINNKNWTADDFMNGYAEMNYHHYKVYKQFKERWRFNHSECMALLSGKGFSASGDIFRDFQNGNFGVRDVERANDFASKIYQLEPYYSGFKRRSFIFAVLQALKHEQFDFEEFLQKLSYQSSKMVNCTSKEQYLRLIEEIYNYKRKHEDKVRFN